MATFNGTSSANTINRSASTTADLINGLGGNDTLIGGNFNDTIDGGTGTDSMSGGLGNDTYIVDSAADIVVEAAGGGTDLVQASVTYTLNSTSAAHVENLTLTGTAAINGTGNALANVLTGNSAANLLSGLAGNDTILGLAGNDTLDGGDGNDSLDGGTGIDSMIGGLGDDAFVVDSVSDKVVEAVGGGTSDRISSSVTLNLSIFAAEVENLTLTGAVAINGTGTIGANFLSGNTAANVLSGLAGDDFISGGDGADLLDGGDGNDSLFGDAGNDTMVGGAGHDLYRVDSAGDSVVEQANAGTDMIQSSVTLNLGTFAAQVENLWLIGSSAINGTGSNLDNFMMGNSAANVLSGLDGNDSFFGDAGNDTIDGGAGNDTIDGGLGDDSMIGGLGNDNFTVNSLTDVVVELAGGGTDQISTSVSLDLSTFAAQVENLGLIQTGLASDPVNQINATGNALNNRITGNGGSNVLNGGLGVDTLQGGDGNDTYVVDGTSVVAGQPLVLDTVIESATGGFDLVMTSLSSYELGANIEDLTLTGNNFISSGIGNELDNTIIGSGSFIDELAGGDGDDFLSGDIGLNFLLGENGNDTLFGGSARDILIGDQDRASANAAGVPLADEDFGAGNDVLIGGGGEDDLYGNGGADRLSGGDGTDYANGGSGNDTITGGLGDDILEGGLGNDSMDGGAGIDIVVAGLGDDIVKGGDGDDQLDGGEGNDTLQGGLGSDMYAAFDEFGADVISDVDSTVGATNRDELRFLSAGYENLWFKQINTDLEISQVGSANKVTIQGWFSGAASQIETIYDDATGHQLNAQSVAALVNTMAGFVPQVITDSSNATLVDARNQAWITL